MAPRSARPPPPRATTRRMSASRSMRRSCRFRADDPGTCAGDATAAISSTARSRRASMPRALAGAKVINMSLGGSAPGSAAAVGDAARGQRRHHPGHFGRQRRRGSAQGRQCRSVRAGPGADISRPGHHRRIGRRRQRRRAPISTSCRPFRTGPGQGQNGISPRSATGSGRSTTPAPASSIRAPASRRRSSPARWRWSRRPFPT